MSLFITETPKVEKQPLTKEIAKQSYDFLKQGIKPTAQFIEHGISFEHSQEVIKEIKRLESEIVNYVKQDNSVTKEYITSQLKSDYLNTDTVMEDVEDYNPSYQEGGRTYAEFKAAILQNQD